MSYRYSLRAACLLWLAGWIRSSYWGVFQWYDCRAARQQLWGEQPNVIRAYVLGARTRREGEPRARVLAPSATWVLLLSIICTLSGLQRKERDSQQAKHSSLSRVRSSIIGAKTNRVFKNFDKIGITQHVEKPKAKRAIFFCRWVSIEAAAFRVCIARSNAAYGESSIHTEANKCIQGFAACAAR